MSICPVVLTAPLLRIHITYQGNNETFAAINDALEEMNAHSFCDDLGIGTCKDKDMEKAKIIKKFLSEKLAEAEEEDIEPTMAFLFARIEEETGILEEVAEDIIQVSCVVLCCPCST